VYKIRLSLQISLSACNTVRIDVAPSSVLRFNLDKIGIMSLVDLCSFYLPKII